MPKLVMDSEICFTQFIVTDRQAKCRQYTSRNGDIKVLSLPKESSGVTKNGKHANISLT